MTLASLGLRSPPCLVLGELDLLSDLPRDEPRGRCRSGARTRTSRSGGRRRSGARLVRASCPSQSGSALRTPTETATVGMAVFLRSLTMAVYWPRAAARVERRAQAGALVPLEPAEDRLVVVGRRSVLERAAEVVPAVEVRADGGGVEARPVVELDVPRGRTCTSSRHARRSARRELGLADALPGTSWVSLVDLFRDSERFAVRDECGIQISRIRRPRKDQRPLPLPAPATPSVTRGRRGGGQCLLGFPSPLLLFPRAVHCVTALQYYSDRLRAGRLEGGERHG